MLRQVRETKAILRTPRLYFKYADHVRELRKIRDQFYERNKKAGVQPEQIPKLPLFHELDEIEQINSEIEPTYTEKNMHEFKTIKEQIEMAGKHLDGDCSGG